MSRIAASGWVLARQLDRLETVTGLGADGQTLRFEQLAQVEPDQRLVFGDQHMQTIVHERSSFRQCFIF